MIYKRILALFAAVAVSTIMLLGLWVGATASPTFTPLSQPALTELLPGHDYINWYTDSVRATATHPTAYFGAYKFEPVGDLLYLGYGSGRPAETAGSLLAVTNGSLITPLADLDEEGFIDMTAVNGTLFIPGPDPHYIGGWELGNFYVKEPGQPITKYRNLPNVIHTWGAWYDTGNDVLYAAVSSHLGDNATWTGEIFSSTNRAVSWTRVATKTSGVGNYRTYDIIGFNEKLYIIWDDNSWQCGLAVSDDQGLSWTRLTTASQQLVTCRNRLHIWQDKLLVLSRDQKSIIAVDQANTLTVHPLHDYQITSWPYNALANDGDYLYAVAEHGQIIRTNDLTNWQLMARTDLDFFSVAYWPHHDWLIVGERGNGRIWKLDLATAQPISPAPSTAQYVILMVADGWGDNHIAAAATYSGKFPPYRTWPRYWMTTYAAGGGYDPTWADLNYLNLGATDSAAAATALYTGRKTTSGFVSVDPGGNRLTTISERAQAIGKTAGAVSSVYLSHATPGAWMGHNDSRANGFAIADEGLWGDPNTTGIATDPGYGGGHGPTLPPQDVIIAAGHPGWNGSTYVNAAMRDKLADESGNPGAFTFVERIADSADGGARLLAAADLVTTSRLAGLFGGAGGNLEYRLANGSGHNAENPTLAQMTTAALTVLARNPEGFVLMVEGGAVDWASHSNNMNQMVGEMLAFNEAVQAVVDWVEAPGNGSNWDNTLVIVTGDHETGYLTAGPDVSPHFSIGSVTAVTIANEKVVDGTGGRRASWNDANSNNLIDSGEAVYWMWNSGQHTNMLVPLYARGAGASRAAAYAQLVDPRWGAYLDNTAVFEIMDLALRRTEVVFVNEGQSYAVGDLAFTFAPGELGTIASMEVITFTVDHPQATHAGLQTDIYWRLRGLDSNSQPADNFTATLTVTVPFAPGPNDKLCRYTGTGWDCGLASDHAHGSNWIARSGITQFSEWTVGKSVDPTAVTLQTISAQHQSLPGLAFLFSSFMMALALAIFAWQRQ